MVYSGAQNMIARNLPSRPSTQAKLVEGLVQPEVWTMYDTVTIAVSGAPGGSDYNFGALPAQIPLFNAHTLGSRGAAITSMTTNSGYVDFPFKAYGIGVEVFSDGDNDTLAATGQSAGTTFVESIVNWGALTLQFATDYKLIMPISDLPAGAGVVYGPRVQTQAAPADVAEGTASNGLQTVQGRALWKDYILFRGKDTPFIVNLVLQTTALAKINALVPLVGSQQCGIRVKFWGYRGKALVTGAPFRG
jgi:hypothetical protein